MISSEATDPESLGFSVFPTSARQRRADREDEGSHTAAAKA
jgi:hypothetical protein